MLSDEDRIILSGLVFFGHHGVFPEEARLGQRFGIDLELGVDMTRASRTDDMADGVSYADVHAVVAEAFGERRFKLIEALARHIMERLFAAFPAVRWIRIRLAKPEAPLPIAVGQAAIEMVRKRGEL